MDSIIYVVQVGGCLVLFCSGSTGKQGNTGSVTKSSGIENQWRQRIQEPIIQLPDFRSLVIMVKCDVKSLSIMNDMQIIYNTNCESALSGPHDRFLIRPVWFTLVHRLRLTDIFPTQSTNFLICNTLNMSDIYIDLNWKHLIWSCQSIPSARKTHKMSENNKILC